MSKEVKVVKVVDWTIPYCGNNHYLPYGTIKVTDGTTTKCCKTKGDKWTDHEGYQYITFNRKRYKIINSGTMFYPQLSLEIV